MILPILEKDGHPGPYRRTTHVDVLKVAARGHEWQLSSKRCCGLCELRHSEPPGDYRYWEGLLEHPMLGAPLNGSEYLCCKLLGLVAERRQALNSLVVRAEGAAENGSTPSDVRLGIPYYFVL